LLQPQLNRTVSSRAVTITKGNIGAETIGSHLKQTKRDLVRGVSSYLQVDPNKYK